MDKLSAIKTIEWAMYEIWDDQSLDEDMHAINRLIELRRKLLDNLYPLNDECKELLRTFNVSLRTALLNLKHNAERYYKMLADNISPNEKVSVKACLWLGSDYPLLHPDQSDIAKQVWEILISRECATYDDGASTPLFLVTEDFPSDLNFLGLEDEDDCWNEGLEREYTQDLHLVSAFHNLWDHCHFALMDLIYVRDFRTEITASIESLNI